MAETPDLQPDLKAETLAAPSTRSDAGNIEQNRNIVKCKSHWQGFTYSGNAGWFTEITTDFLISAPVLTLVCAGLLTPCPQMKSHQCFACCNALPADMPTGYPLDISAMADKN